MAHEASVLAARERDLAERPDTASEGVGDQGRREQQRG
jgi:hypothetical protein